MTKAEILKRVRAKCLDCCCGSSNEVKRCHIESCPLHPIRFGVNPDKRELPEEKKMVLRERMKKSASGQSQKIDSDEKLQRKYS